MTGSTILITVSGPPGSGTTTLAKTLATKLDLELLGGGMIFRQMAADRDMSLAEFSELAERDDSIDRNLDERLSGEIQAHLAGERDTDGGGLVVDSRLAGWHADGDADLSVWVDAPVEVRASRIEGRKETPDELRAREQSEAQRYREYYDIDIDDTGAYDLVIDTHSFSKDGVVSVVEAALDDVF